MQWHFAFQTQSVKAYFFQTTRVKVCGIRTMPATAYAFQMTSVRAFAFQTQSVTVYFFRTTCVKVCGVRTMPATVYAFHMTSARAFALQTQRVKAYLPTRDCASTFRTTLVSAHAAPNTRRPCVCAVDDDGHSISLRVDECHSLAFSSKLRMSRYVVSG